jgi:hypothetical protein
MGDSDGRDRVFWELELTKAIKEDSLEYVKYDIPDGYCEIAFPISTLSKENASSDTIISLTALKAWLIKHYPRYKPAFLFDDEERRISASVENKIAHLQDQLEAMKLRAVNAEQKAQDYEKKIADKEKEIKSLKKRLENADSADDRSELTYLRIIAALMHLYWAKISGGKSKKINQSTVINNVHTTYGHIRGLSERTLWGNFQKALQIFSQDIEE